MTSLYHQANWILRFSILREILEGLKCFMHEDISKHTYYQCWWTVENANNEEMLSDAWNISAYDSKNIPEITQPYTRLIQFHNFYCVMAFTIFDIIKDFPQAWHQKSRSLFFSSKILPNKSTAATIFNLAKQMVNCNCFP